MKKLIRMITPFIAILFLVGCGSSDDIIAEIRDDIVDAKFTSDILVGKTYTTTEEGVVTTVTFTETEVTVEVDGETTTLSYSINEDGVLILPDDDFHTLISIYENGDLLVENEGVESDWVLMDGTTDPTLKFTSDLLVGKTYTTTDEGGTSTFSFTETEISGEEYGEPFTLPYSINEDGVLVLEGTEFHTLISIDENGDLLVENDGIEDVWVLGILS